MTTTSQRVDIYQDAATGKYKTDWLSTGVTAPEYATEKAARSAVVDRAMFMGVEPDVKFVGIRSQVA